MTTFALPPRLPITGLLLLFALGCTRTPSPDTTKEPVVAPGPSVASSATASTSAPVAAAAGSTSTSTPPSAPAPSASTSPPLAPGARQARSPIPPLPVYKATGTIKSVDRSATRVAIAHDDIPGYMSAMTMPFEAGAPEQLSHVTKGDRVSFSFTDDGNGNRVLQTLRVEK